MPIPSSINDLDVNPNNNSPQGSEAVGPNANGYLQALSAFIKQLAVGTGLKPTAAVDMNGQKITNIAQGTISTTSKDAVRGDQLYKVGEVRMYHGAVANIATIWGAGWQLCDGTNGTADLRDRFVVGAGGAYTMGSTGGAASNTLTVAQLPAHSHPVNDPGHVHGTSITDPGHVHGTNDPGHAHGIAGAPQANGSSLVATSDSSDQRNPSTRPAFTGVTVLRNPTGIAVSVANNVTGISTQNTGAGAPVENRPPYFALCFIEYVGP